MRLKAQLLLCRTEITSAKAYPGGARYRTSGGGFFSNNSAAELFPTERSWNKNLETWTRPTNRLNCPTSHLNRVYRYQFRRYKIEREAEVFCERSACRVARYGKHFVIKYGPNVSLTEGENMLFVRHMRDETASSTRRDGLDQVWARLDTPEKCRIAGTLRLQIEALRNIPAPGYFGCIGRRPFEENMFWAASEDGSDDAKFNGPFDTKSELNDALVQSYRVCGGRDQKANYYRRVLHLVLREKSIVFTHGNLQRKNIMLKPDGQPVLIGWKAAGWYPAYWEHVIAMFRRFGARGWRILDDWHEYLPRIINEYPNEYVWFDMIRHELWY
ncbi:hypothetical protein E4U26_002059 [Claviceps purpurea]|nr:hypothetical protein E4U26_002059 [Claviceps purpurea]